MDWPCKPCSKPTAALSTPALEGEDTDDIYNVDRFLAERVRNGKVLFRVFGPLCTRRHRDQTQPISFQLEYLVKWEGYSASECTWEPFQSIEYVRNHASARLVLVSCDELCIRSWPTHLHTQAPQSRDTSIRRPQNHGVGEGPVVANQLPLINWLFTQTQTFVDLQYINVSQASLYVKNANGTHRGVGVCSKASIRSHGHAS